MPEYDFRVRSVNPRAVRPWYVGSHRSAYSSTVRRVVGVRTSPPWSLPLKARASASVRNDGRCWVPLCRYGTTYRDPRRKMPGYRVVSIVGKPLSGRLALGLLAPLAHDLAHGGIAHRRPGVPLA